MQTTEAGQFTSITGELIFKAESQPRGAKELTSKHPKPVHLTILLHISQILALLLRAPWVVPSSNLFVFWWGDDNIETEGWADGKMPPEACVWWPGTIMLFVLVCVCATEMAYFWEPVALENLFKWQFCELMLFCTVVVVVVEGCPCSLCCSIFPQFNCMVVLASPNGDTPVALHSFVLLHKAVEALSSFVLFPDFLPGSQVHRDYLLKIYVQCMEVSVLRNYMGLTVLQFSSVSLSMKIKFVHHHYGSVF